MRILHTADWHLGRLFHGIHLTEEQALVLDQLVKIARETRPDIIIISGDIFDRPIPPAEAISILDEVVCRLVLDMKLSMIILPGNHDSPERLRFGNKLFEQQNLFVVTEPFGRKIVLEDKYGPVNFYVIPYISHLMLAELLNATPQESPQNLWSRILPKPSGRSVLCAHLFVQGGQESPSEAVLVGGSDLLPASLFDKYSFCALGHLHQHQTISSHIHYPGAILPYSFRESKSKKGVSLVEIGPKGEVSIEFIELLPPKKLVILEGSFQQLLLGPRINDYVKIILTDEEPVFEAFRRLKAVYPNLLALEQPYFHGFSKTKLGTNLARQEEELLFRGFIKEVTGKLPTKEEETIFKAIVDSLRTKNETYSS